MVILDHLTDAGNLGAIARSAEAVGACGLVIPNKRSAKVDASTYKSSAGAIAHMPVAQVPNLVQVMARLKERGFWVAGASEQADDVIWRSNLKGKIALVMGNESEGLSRVVKESCDFLVKLPQMGEVASLNVAQASTACMYEWLQAELLRVPAACRPPERSRHTAPRSKSPKGAAGRGTRPSHDPGGSRTEVRFAPAIPRIPGTTAALADLLRQPGRFGNRTSAVKFALRANRMEANGSREHCPSNAKNC